MSILGAYIMPHPPIMLPMVGKGEERKIQATIDGCEEIAGHIEAIRPQTIVIASPHAPWDSSHFIISGGPSARGDLSAFRTRGFKMEVDYDTKFALALEANAKAAGLPALLWADKADELDHGTMVPLYWVNSAMKQAAHTGAEAVAEAEIGPADSILKNYRLVRVAPAFLSPEECREFGRAIRKTAAELGQDTVFIASGDLSHKLREDGPYGFVKEGPVFDARIGEIIEKGKAEDFLSIDSCISEPAAECGLKSFQILAGVVEGLGAESRLLSLEGPFGVGYATGIYEVKSGEQSRGIDCSEQGRSVDCNPTNKQNPYTKLAKESLEHYIRTGKMLPASTDKREDLPPEMRKKRAGVFVSLHIGDRLRGCIGTIAPVTPNIAMEIIRNAVSAGVEDPRFPEVREEELDKLIYKVDVLGEAEEIYSLEDLDVKKYGVIVSAGFRRGLLLPDLEGVDTVEEQVSIAMQKAGIPRDQEISLQRFEVIRHE